MDNLNRKFNAHDILTVLRRQIISEKYLPHEKLPSERILAEQFGVARGTLREALKKLEELKLVNRYSGKGTFVASDNIGEAAFLPSSTRPLELMEARFALEPQIARLAVLNANDKNLSKIEEILATLDKTVMDPQSFAENDERFHLELAKLTQNTLLVWMMRHINKARAHSSWVRVRGLTLSSDMIARYNKQHRAIFAAIRDRDADTAAKSMRLHLSEARESMINVTT